MTFVGAEEKKEMLEFSKRMHPKKIERIVSVAGYSMGADKAEAVRTGLASVGFYTQHLQGLSDAEYIAGLIEMSKR